MMEQVTIQFNNYPCKGTLFSSRDRFPFYYWYYFEDKQLADTVGDCIGFEDKSGDLVLTERLEHKFEPIAEAVRSYILNHYYTSGDKRRKLAHK